MWNKTERKICSYKEERVALGSEIIRVQKILQLPIDKKGKYKLILPTTSKVPTSIPTGNTKKNKELIRPAEKNTVKPNKTWRTVIKREHSSSSEVSVE